MSDEIPEPLVPILLGMQARIELLQHVVAFLCAKAAPREDLRAYLETLTFPVFAENDPGGTKAMHEAIDKLFEMLSQRYNIAPGHE